MEQKNLNHGNTKDSKKKYKSRNYCITWNNYKKEDINYIMEQKDFKYVFQEERGDEGTKHLQGIIMYPNPISFESMKKQWPKCHIEKTRNKKKSILYCSKRDTRISEVVYNNIGLIYPKSLKDPLKGNELYGWQQILNDKLKTEPDDRTINWYWSTNGNKGKSSFVKWFTMKHKTTTLICSGKASDMKYMVAKRCMLGLDPEVIFFDVPRQNMNYLSYTGIEEIKNGCFMSPKYDCENILMNPPHIVVFANSEPNIDAMSIDRWYIKCLDTPLD